MFSVWSETHNTSWYVHLQFGCILSVILTVSFRPWHPEYVSFIQYCSLSNEPHLAVLNYQSSCENLSWCNLCMGLLFLYYSLLTISGSRILSFEKITVIVEPEFTPSAVFFQLCILHWRSVHVFRTADHSPDKHCLVFSFCFYKML